MSAESFDAEYAELGLNCEFSLNDLFKFEIDPYTSSVETFINLTFLFKTFLLIIFSIEFSRLNVPKELDLTKLSGYLIDLST